MECYISQDYFPKLEELLTSAKDDILTERATNLNVLFQLLSALPLNIDLKDLDIKKFAKSLVGNKTYTSFKDRIIINAIKNQKLKTCHLEGLETKINNLSAFYFFNSDDASEFSITKGIVCKGLDYKGNSFYDDCTVADLPINKGWELVKDTIPPTNAMLIVDQYLFSIPNQERKLQNLIEFIELYKGKLEIPFHLSILFSATNRYNELCSPLYIQQAFQKLSEIPNTKIQLFIHNYIPRHDRLIFTNYTSGNIGIPFDDRETRFTQNFLGRENSSAKILRNYRNYENDLIFWYTFLNNIPYNIGNVQTKWESSKFTNRLFEPFLVS